jgi:hypothetical protein
MSEENYNKIIFKTAGITIGCLLLLSVLSLSLFTLFSPISLAKISSSLGFNNLSVYYYELSYKKTEDINDLYNLLNKTIQIKNDEKIVSNFELLYKDGSGEYYNFVNGINEQVLTNNSNNEFRMHIANEDRYLKSKYVSALYKINQKEKALQFAYNDFLNEEFSSVEDYDKINFIITSYIFELNYSSGEDYNVFDNYTAGEFENFDFFNTAISYYNNIKNIYLLEYDEQADGNEALKLMVVADKLTQVASTIIFLDEALSKAIDTSVFDADIQTFVAHINALSN